MIKSLCASRTCNSEPRRQQRLGSALPGLRVCAACRAGLRDDLLELPDLYTECEFSLAAGFTPRPERVTGSRPETGLVLNEEAIVARSDVMAVLASWSGMVANGRPASKPERRDVTSLVSFLLRHLEWLLAHSAAPEFIDEISSVTADARRTVHPPTGRLVELGPCIRPDCAGTISASALAKDDNPLRDVQCTAGHVWLPHQWLVLSRQIEQAQRERNSKQPEWSGDAG
jgi:hypothetical protein